MADEGEYAVGGATGMEYGDRSKLAEATSFAKAGTGTELPDVEAEDDPGSSGLAFSPEIGGGEADPDIDEVLFAPTDFPDRPLTNGMPFGPGANFSPSPDETEDAFMHRIAIKVLETNGPEDSQVWAARRLAGA